MNVHEYRFHYIDGANMPLEFWDGQPILLVNTASECGYTPQYRKLQRLWEDYRQSQLVVLGLPCNDFGAQEPGTDEKIAAWVREEFGVTFPLTRKIHILGQEAHPLFLDLRDEYGDEILPRWNFTKYLFDGDGRLVERWPSKVEPDDPTLTHAVERNLRAWIV
jgi:glutathione peroxidase